jgi:hypothetical protein
MIVEKEKSKGKKKAGNINRKEIQVKQKEVIENEKILK